MRQCTQCGSTFEDDSVTRCPGDDSPTIAVARATGIPTGSMEPEDFAPAQSRTPRQPQPTVAQPPQYAYQLPQGYPQAPAYGYQMNPYGWAQPVMQQPGMPQQPQYGWTPQTGWTPQQAPQGWTQQPPNAQQQTPDAYAYAAQGARAPESYIGVTVGNFKLQRLLGAGGMGAVFEGVHPIVGNRVAVKLMGISGQVDRDLIDRFFKEAQVLNQVAHDNIVKVIDLGQHNDGFYYCVMEFLDGESLANAMLTRMKLGRVLRLTAQVCDALAAAHARGIVHRDLKPANVMLVKGGNGQELVKLVDFGIAKTAAAPNTSQTQTGTVIGTPAYMAPEQAAGRVSEVDARSDLYALGIMLYEMSTGRHPWAGRAPGEVIAAQISETPKKPGGVVPLPQALESLIMRLLEKRRENRPAEAAQVGHSIRSLLAEVEAQPGTQPAMSPVSRTGQNPAVRPAPAGPGPAATVAMRPGSSQPPAAGPSATPSTPSAPRVGAVTSPVASGNTGPVRPPMAGSSQVHGASPLRWILAIVLLAAVGVAAAVFAGRMNVEKVVGDVATRFGNTPQPTSGAGAANAKLDGLKGAFVSAPSVKACQGALDDYRDVQPPKQEPDVLPRLAEKVSKLDALQACLTGIVPTMPPDQLWAAAYLEGVANLDLVRALKDLPPALSDTARNYRTADGIARYWHELYTTVATDRFRRAREGAPETNRAFVDAFLRELQAN